MVGQADLDVNVERTVVPAIDTTVWLRGRAKNTTAYTLLPGLASVFLGQDFLGRAAVELVQPGAELTLHLGADPFVEVEPAQLPVQDPLVVGQCVIDERHGR